MEPALGQARAAVADLVTRFARNLSPDGDGAACEPTSGTGAELATLVAWRCREVGHGCCKVY